MVKNDIKKEADVCGIKLTSGRKKIIIQCYIMLALPIIGFLVFNLYPVLWTFRWSLFSYNGAAADARYIGLENFITLFTNDAAYWGTWVNTFAFAICKMPFELALAMTLALILNQDIRLRGFFRSAYYMPGVISVAIIGLMFSNMFSYFGVINAILLKLGIITTEIDWFASKHTAMAVIVIASIWNTFGVNVMYLLAALSNVSRDVYEAAKLDGASPARTFFSITLPLISPVFQTILLLSLIGTLSANEFILTLTNGGPGGSTFTVMSYLTKKFIPGFTESAAPPLGYGCAMSVVTGVILGVIAIGYNKLSKKMKETF